MASAEQETPSTASGPLQSRAWLTRTKVDQSPVEGVLELKDGRIRLTLTGRPPKKTARWLEERTGVAGLAERLRAGESATVLDVPREQVEPKFPSKLVSPGVFLTVNGERWTVWFMSPGARGPLGVLMRAGPAYREAKRWREAL